MTLTLPGAKGAARKGAAESVTVTDEALGQLLRLACREREERARLAEKEQGSVKEALNARRALTAATAKHDAAMAALKAQEGASLSNFARSTLDPPCWYHPYSCWLVTPNGGN